MKMHFMSANMWTFQACCVGDTSLWTNIFCRSAEMNSETRIIAGDHRQLTSSNHGIQIIQKSGENGEYHDTMRYPF